MARSWKDVRAEAVADCQLGGQRIAELATVRAYIAALLLGIKGHGSYGNRRWTGTRALTVLDDGPVPLTGRLTDSSIDTNVPASAPDPTRDRRSVLEYLL